MKQAILVLCLTEPVQRTKFKARIRQYMYMSSEGQLVCGRLQWNLSIITPSLATAPVSDLNFKDFVI